MTHTQCFDDGILGRQLAQIPTRALIRATLVLIAINVIVMLWFAVTLTVNVNFTPRPVHQAASQSFDKPSPFEAVPMQPTYKGMKRPTKLEPYFAEVVRFETVPADGSVN